MKARVWQPFVHDRVRGNAQEPRRRRVRIDSPASPDQAGAATGQRAGNANGRSHVRAKKLAATVPVRRPAAHARRAAPARCAVERQRRRTREELDAAAERIAAVLRTRRSTDDLDRVEGAGFDQIEEGVDAAALRAVRVANAVDEHVDLVAGQPAHEHAGHRRARLLQAHARLAFDGLRDNRGGATRDLVGVDDVDGLPGAPNVLDLVGGGGDADFFFEGIELKVDLDWRRTEAAHAQRQPLLDEIGRAHDHQVAALTRNLERELPLPIGGRSRDDGLFRSHDDDGRVFDDGARRILHDSRHRRQGVRRANVERAHGEHHGYDRA
jgi:hypothetical protein